MRAVIDSQVAATACRAPVVLFSRPKVVLDAHRYVLVLGCREAGVGVFLQKVAFELGRSGEDLEDQPAAGNVVSIVSCKDRNPIPPDSSVNRVLRWRTDRPGKDIAQRGKLLSPTRPGR